MLAEFFKVMPTWRYGDDGSVQCDSPQDPLETDVETDVLLQPQ